MTAVVDSTNLIAESDENNNSRSEMVPVPTPPLPCANPAEFAQTVVSALNGKNFDAAKGKMGQFFAMAFWQSQGLSLTPDEAVQQLQLNYIGTTTMLIPDPNKDLDTLLGVQIHTRSWGWKPPPHWRCSPRAGDWTARVNQSDGDLFAALVRPSHGVNVRLWAYSNEVNFRATNARNVFTSTDSYNWGGGPSGAPDIGSFKDVIQPKLLEVLNAPNMETYCDELTKVFPLSVPWPYPDIRYYNLYKPSTSDISFDFRT